MHKRINITLPEETIRLLDRVSAKGDRSGLIDRAIRRYIEKVGKANLRRRLKEGYVRRAEHDLETAEAWFPFDEETWNGKAAVVRPKRGEVYLVSFDPTLGAEIRKTRPALVIQNDIGNRYSPITILAAITSRFVDDLYPTDALVTPPEGGLRVPWVVMLNQIRSVDKRRLLTRLGPLKPATLARVDQALRISVGLVKF